MLRHQRRSFLRIDLKSISAVFAETLAVLSSRKKEERIPRLIGGVGRLLNTVRIQMCELTSLNPFAHVTRQICLSSELKISTSVNGTPQESTMEELQATLI